MPFWSRSIFTSTTTTTEESALPSGNASVSSQKSTEEKVDDDVTTPSSTIAPQSSTMPPPTQNSYYHHSIPTSNSSTAANSIVGSMERSTNLQQHESGSSTSPLSNNNNNNDAAPKFMIFAPKDDSEGKEEEITTNNDTSKEEKNEIKSEEIITKNEVNTENSIDNTAVDLELETDNNPTKETTPVESTVVASKTWEEQDSNSEQKKRPPTDDYNQVNIENNNNNHDWNLYSEEEENKGNYSNPNDKLVEGFDDEINNPSSEELHDQEYYARLRRRLKFLEQPVVAPKIHESLNKRRDKYNARLFEMDDKLACLETVCANEGMDRNAALREIFPRGCARLQYLSDGFFMSSKFMLDKERAQILDMQKRLSTVHNKFLHYKHHELNEIQFDEYDSIQVDLMENVEPTLKMQGYKTDKRELTVYRKFESLAGLCSRRYREECSTRVGCIQALENPDIDLEQRKTDYLLKIKELRRLLNEERATRRKRDAQILKDVHMKSSALQRALLEAVDDKS